MREQIIQALAMALLNNQGNRLSTELINGIVQSVGQFALSMEQKEEDDGAGQAGTHRP